MTVFGNPINFALIVKDIKIWSDGANYKNGLFHFVVDQKIFPRRARVATLSADLGCLSVGNALLDCPENEAISDFDAEGAFRGLLNGMLPYILMDEDDIPDDFETDYTYQASTGNLEDEGCLVFAVAVGSRLRILAAEVERYSHCDRYYIRDVSEVWVERDEVASIIGQAKSAFEKGTL